MTAAVRRGRCGVSTLTGTGRRGNVAGRCLHCDGPHEIEFCPAVMAAFVKDYDYQGNQHSSAAADPRKFRGQAVGGRRKKALTK